MGIVDVDYNAYHINLKHTELNIKENNTLVKHMNEVDEDGFFDIFELEVQYEINLKQLIQQSNQTFYQINAMIMN